MSFIRLEDNQEITLNLNVGAKPQKMITPLHYSSKTEFISSYLDTISRGDIPFVLNPQIPENIAKTLLPQNLVHTGESGHYICTSGTTSHKPKTFFFPRTKFELNAEAHNKSLELEKNLNILFPLPFTHSFGVVVGIWAALQGQHQCYFNEKPMGVLDLLEQFEGKDLVYLTPSLVRQIIKYSHKRKAPLPQPKKISIGSSTLFQEEAEKMQSLFPESQLFYTYGLTEMGPRVSTLKLASPFSMSLGKPLEGVSWSIKEGVLHITSPYRAEGLDEEFNTSDLVNEDYQIQGRSDDTIIYQGRNIYPSEVENLFLNFSPCALVGLPNALHGQIPVLVFEGEHSEVEIWSRLKEKVPTDYLPKRIYFNTPLPRTSMGKIMKKQLSESL